MAVHTHDAKHTYVFTPLQHHTTYYNVVIVVFVYIITFLWQYLLPNIQTYCMNWSQYLYFISSEHYERNTEGILLTR